MIGGVAAKAVITWLLLVPVAIANGALREKAITPRLGETAGRALSSLSLAAAIYGASEAFVRWSGARSQRALGAVGASWLALTLLFEFGFGHFVEHKPWDVLLRDYNILRGRIWALVVVVTALGPVLAGARRTQP